MHASELQCRGLGIKAAAFDEEGNELQDQVGELVVTEPMPSMPLFLWNDQDNQRYLESYFDLYPGIWRHGDWDPFRRGAAQSFWGDPIPPSIASAMGSGSSEIYSVVEDLPPKLRTASLLGLRAPMADTICLFMLFSKEMLLDDALKNKINKSIRSALSPRHVPDSIHAIGEVPHTLNGKKLEVPVKKILAGFPVERAVNVDSMANPGAIDYFVNAAREFDKKGDDYG